MRPIDADVFCADILKGKPIGLTICQYSESDILYMIKKQPTITPQPNDPLTLEELREMDGEPVWVHELAEPGRGQWRIIKGPWYDVGLHLDGFGMLECEDMGKTWLAYRRKPEED